MVWRTISIMGFPVGCVSPLLGRKSVYGLERPAAGTSSVLISQISRPDDRARPARTRRYDEHSRMAGSGADSRSVSAARFQFRDSPIAREQVHRYVHS